MDKGKEFIIGIDPDVSGSGYCILKNGKIEQLLNLELWEIFEAIKSMNIGEKRDFIVLVEKSDSNNTWHKGGKGAARRVGQNQEIANQIIRFCKHFRIPHRAITPKGFSSVNHVSFSAITKTSFSRTNPETRVAGLIAYHAYRGLI